MRDMPPPAKSANTLNLRARQAGPAGAQNQPGQPSTPAPAAPAAGTAGVPVGGLPTPQPIPARPAEQGQQDIAARQRQYSVELESARNQSNRVIAELAQLRQSIRPPSRGKYYIVGYIGLGLDAITILEDAVGGDATVIVYIIKIVIKALLFAGFWYIAHKDKVYSQLLGQIEQDVNAKIDHLEQRAQNLKARASQQARARGRPSARAARAPAPTAGKTGGARRVGSAVLNPVQTFKYWLLELIPYADIFPWEAYSVYKLYKTTQKNYQNVLQLIDGEYLTALQNFNLQRQELEAELDESQEA